MEKTRTIQDFNTQTIDKKELLVVRNKRILYPVIKRTIDILGGLVGVLLLIPIMIVVWIMRKVNHENGPMFYEQLRIGKNGNYFRLYKFRSMCMNADKKLKEYLDNNEDAKKEFEKNFKLKDDPRITKTGSFLRKTSLDEWPQFINLLRWFYEPCWTKTNSKRRT